MLKKNDLLAREPYLWEVPASYRHDMRVPARVYASDDLLDAILDDRSLEQLVNVATLPGIVGYALAMPDIHQGYGFPIGGVAATALPGGVISPGGIGYDINCGVRLLASDLDEETLRPHLPSLATALNERCPSGTGQSGRYPLNKPELQAVMTEGAAWCVERGMGTAEDLRRTEDSGRLDGAEPRGVSQRAWQRGASQLGTLGSGNHFLEVDVVRETYSEDAAEAFQLRVGQIVVLIHSGSRGFGHQICTDYVRDFQRATRQYGISLPDRELVCAPVDSPEGQAYLGAMRCAANFAFANRQALAHQARRAFEEVLAPHKLPISLYQVYDLAHNIGKIERHQVNGASTELCVHRKGATRAFGPGHPDVPEAYRQIGQPVLVPGSMGTASYVLAGAPGAMEHTFGSCCHGAGRAMSRRQAQRAIKGRALRAQLEERGIVVRAGSMSGLAEEAPHAYKDVDRVVNVVEAAGIARKVARLEPVAVIKG
jgi:tRNA-splicing ligase RtcB (3'-phosphate/5'-hydroxy nucleic acid ligase)